MKEKSDKFIEKVSRKIKLLAAKKEMEEMGPCTFSPAVYGDGGQKRTTEEFLAAQKKFTEDKEKKIKGNKKSKEIEE